MANWSRPAIIEELIIDDEVIGEVDLSGGFVEFSYYESLFSPHITATLAYIDTGNAVYGQNDVQERLGTIYSSVSNFKGKKVKLKLNHDSSANGLEFDTYPLEITRASSLAADNKRRIYAFRLASEYATKNENIGVQEKYYNSISDSVQSILVNKLGVPTERIKKDNTKNSEAFNGLDRRPFELIMDLCRMAAPESGTPGYFFYETIDGFNFKSVHTLLQQPVNGTGGYTYADVAPVGEQGSFRILEYNPPQESDALNQIRGGNYKLNLITFDINTFIFKEQMINLSEEVESTVGSDEQPPTYQTSDNREYGRTVFNILDSGNNEQGISTSINNDPKQWVTSMMRYGSLLSNTCDIVVPCNLNLRVGNIIDCSFPRLGSDPAQGISDEKISGKYLILHLAHHFTSDGQTGSTTHITMVRDTHGMYSSSGEE